MSDAGGPLFHFSQIEVPWALGPPDGRYLLRRAGESSDAPATHVLVLATLGAVERRRTIRRRDKYEAQLEPEPIPVVTGRATIIDVFEPFTGLEQARSWLEGAGEAELSADLQVLNHALHAFRVVTANPYLLPVGREQTLVARVGFGAGERVADGLWAEAHELSAPTARRRRAAALVPQARLAALLGGRERALPCEELTLRARLDLDHGRDREAALQLHIALDAALAELPADQSAAALAERLAELRGQREAVVDAAQSALSGALSEQQRAAVEFTLGRIEAALRARVVANA